MAIHDVECCEQIQVHEDLVNTARAQLPEEDTLYDLDVYKRQAWI